MSGRIELRYADMPWGEELDEVVVKDVDLCVHLEDLGQSIYIGVSDGPRHLSLSAGMGPLPRGMWWSELQVAWHERRWPCFRRVRLYLIEDDDGARYP